MKFLILATVVISVILIKEIILLRRKFKQIRRLRIFIHDVAELRSMYKCLKNVIESEEFDKLPQINILIVTQENEEMGFGNPKQLRKILSDRCVCYQKLIA